MTDTIFELREFELIKYTENLSDELPDPLLFYLLKTIDSSKYDEILRNNNITHFSQYLDNWNSNFDLDGINVVFNCIKVLIEFEEIERDDVFNLLNEISKIGEIYDDLRLLTFLILLTKHSMNLLTMSHIFNRYLIM